VAAAFSAIAIWSLNAAAGGVALARLSVLQVLACQFGAAFLVLICFRVLTSGTPTVTSPGRRERLALIGVVGLSGTIVLQYVAFATAPLLAANAIAYAWPLMVAGWMALAPGMRGSHVSLALTAVGFVGVVVLFASRQDTGQGGSAPLLGYVAALGSAVAMAGYTLTAGRSGARTADLLLVGTGAGALGTVPAALLQGDAWSPAWAVALALGIGVAMMALGYGLWTHAMAHPIGARLAPAAYATPLLSTGVLLATGQQLSPFGLVGCALIVVCAAGVVLDALPQRSDDVASLNGEAADRAHRRPRRATSAPGRCWARLAQAARRRAAARS
jgi:drug/metabolite transporter (DMT)-like permease